MADKAYQIAFGEEAVDDDFYGDVVSLRVEENTSMASTMQLRLSTKQDDSGAWDYLEDPRLAPFTKVSVRVGFSSGGGLAGALGAVAGALGAGGSGDDGLEPVFDGFITSVNLSLGSNPGDSHIDVGAMDTSVLMSLEEKVVTWKDMSDSDIVHQVVSAYGVQVQADITATVHQENDTTIVQRGADIQFVRDLAALNGLEFYFETDKDSAEVVAYFRAAQLDRTPQADLAVQFGEDSNLRSFSARLNAQRPLAVKTQQIDIKTNSANSAQATNVQLTKLGDKDANALAGGPLGSLVTPKDAQAQMLALGPPTSDPTELQTIAQAVRDEAGWFIAAEGEINSDAYQAVLRPHRMVLVKGAGTPFSGKYYVTRVVHELEGSGSYKQTFEARRNARDLDGSEQFGGGELGPPIPGL
jgi:phage protein D